MTNPMTKIKLQYCPEIAAEYPTVDQWIKVGTTTIDGTFEQVREAFGATWENVDHLQYSLASGDVLDFGGRSLMVHSREVNDHGVMVCCDIVRRKSELDAERLNAEMTAYAEHKDMVAKAFAKPCPECGPHGNRGEVLLAASWARCTTCNGGKAGDLWGEVEASKVNDEPPSVAEGHKPGHVSWAGFQVPTRAEFENYLAGHMAEIAAKIGKYDDDTIAKWRDFIDSVTPRAASDWREDGESDDEYRRRIRAHFGVQ